MIVQLDAEAAANLKRLMTASEERDPEKVLKKALSLYREVLRETGLGGKCVIQKDDGTDYEIIL